MIFNIGVKNFWRSLTPWQKGALIAVLFIVTDFILFLALSAIQIREPYAIDSQFYKIDFAVRFLSLGFTMLPLLPGALFSNMVFGSTDGFLIYTCIHIAISISLYAIIGSIIGWITGRIKKNCIS